MSQTMDNPLNWSLRVGTIWRIVIRLHLFFIVGAAFMVVQSLRGGEGIGPMAVVKAVGGVAILFGIVLLHEFGHCWGARRSGGEATEILMWPLGGLATVDPPHKPDAHLLTAISGPMVNLIICAVVSALLVILCGGLGAVPWNPLHPFTPVGGTRAGELHDWLITVFGLSLILLLFNLLPIYPLDGGRVLHGLLWPKKGYAKATLAATFVGMVGAIVLGVAGLLTGEHLLLLIAVFGYLTCYNDRRMAKATIAEGGGEFGYDFSKGFGAFDETHDGSTEPGLLERRRLAKEESRRQREAELREEHRQRADAILAKIHEHGIESLSKAERKILEEETKRQRAGS